MTLLEVMLALAIAGVLMAGLLWLFDTAWQVSQRASLRHQVQGELNLLLRLVSQDGQMAQAGASRVEPDRLTLAWHDQYAGANIPYTVTYTVVGDQIQRQFSAGGGPAETQIIVRHLEQSGGIVLHLSGRLLTVAVTCTLHSGAGVETVTGQTTVWLRPGGR